MANEATEVKENGVSEEEVNRRIDETARRITRSFEERLAMEDEMSRRKAEDMVGRLT